MVWCGGGNQEETINTLRYATRASKIINDTGVNEIDNLDAFMGQYWNEIQSLKEQLQSSTAEVGVKDTELQNARAETEQKVSTLRSQAEYLEQQLYEAQTQAASEKEQLLADIDALQAKLDEALAAKSQQDQGQHAALAQENAQLRDGVDLLRRQVEEERQARDEEVSQLKNQVQDARDAAAAAPPKGGPGDEQVTIHD